MSEQKNNPYVAAGMGLGVPVAGAVLFGIPGLAVGTGIACYYLYKNYYRDKKNENGDRSSSDV
jgi:hypothetical protein